MDTNPNSIEQAIIQMIRSSQGAPDPAMFQPRPVQPVRVEPQPTVGRQILAPQEPAEEPEIPSYDYDSDIDYDGRKIKITRKGEVLKLMPEGDYRPITNEELVNKIKSTPGIAELYSKNPALAGYGENEPFEYNGRQMYYRSGDVYAVDPDTGDYALPGSALDESLAELSRKSYVDANLPRYQSLSQYLDAPEIRNWNDLDYLKTLPAYQSEYDKAYKGMIDEAGNHPVTAGARLADMRKRMEEAEKKGDAEAVKSIAGQIEFYTKYGAAKIPTGVGTEIYSVDTPGVDMTPEQRLLASGWDSTRLQREAENRARLALREQYAAGEGAKINFSEPARKIISSIPDYMEWYAANRYSMDPEEASLYNPASIIGTLEEAARSGDTVKAAEAIAQLRAARQKFMDAEPIQGDVTTNRVRPNILERDGRLLGFLTPTPVITKPDAAQPEPKVVAVQRPASSSTQPNYGNIQVPLYGQLVDPGEAATGQRQSKDLDMNFSEGASQVIRAFISNVRPGLWDQPMQVTGPENWRDIPLGTMRDNLINYGKAAFTDYSNWTTLKKKLSAAMQNARYTTVIRDKDGNEKAVTAYVWHDKDDETKLDKKTIDAILNDAGQRIAAASRQGDLAGVYLPGEILKGGAGVIRTIADWYRQNLIEQFLKDNNQQALTFINDTDASGTPIHPKKRPAQVNDLFRQYGPEMAVYGLFGY